MSCLKYIFTVFAVVALAACNHGNDGGAQAPSAQQSLNVTKSIRINASPADVWALAGDYYNVEAWHPAIVSTQKSGAKKPTRMLILGNGALIREELTDYEDGKSYSYSIVSSPLPVRNYTATLSVAPDGDGSLVTWVADFNSAGASDEDATKTIDGVFGAGLSSLQSKLGG